MNEGIYAGDLTEKETFVRFERMQSYIIPPHRRHQIVHNLEQDDIGIAVSINGRRDFRKYDDQRIYWFTKPYAYVVFAPMRSQGISIDLSHLV